VGLVTISLPEKLYFYHSTAECFFAGALALQLGYFVWIYNAGPNKFTTIGLGFVFGVGSILLFFVSSVLMALDDIMKSCRTSILYTDEMATVYSSSGPKAAPAVSAAAKAFASAGTTGGGASSKGNDKNANNDKQNINGGTQGASASKGSEMVTGAKNPRGGGVASEAGGGGGSAESHLQRLAEVAAASQPRSMTTTTTTTTTTTLTMTEPTTTTEAWTASHYDAPTDFYLLDGYHGDQHHHHHASMPFQAAELRNYAEPMPT